MDRLNKTGRVLMEYRSEFQKHYGDSIDEALKEAVGSMYNDKKIDEKVFRNIFNENIPNEDFERILSKNKEFTKSNIEINYEFDQIRKKINEYMISIAFVDSMNTKNSVDMNKIIIIHQFDLNKTYLMSSFGVNQTEIIPLMKRRGFIEKFAVLRLNQVLKEVYNELRVPEDVDHGYSLVYYNKLTHGFSIDYKYYLNINLTTNDEKTKQLVNKIRDLDKVVDKKFHNKLGNNYFINVNNVKGLEIKNNKKPVTKILTIDSPQIVVEQSKNAQEKKKDINVGNNQNQNKSQQKENIEPQPRVKQQPQPQPQPQNQQKNKENLVNIPEDKSMNQYKNKNKEKEIEIIIESKKHEIPGNIPIKKIIDDSKKLTDKVSTINPEIEIDKKNDNVKDNKSQNEKNKNEPVIEEFEIDFDISDKDFL